MDARRANRNGERRNERSRRKRRKNSEISGRGRRFCATIGLAGWNDAGADGAACRLSVADAAGAGGQITKGIRHAQSALGEMPFASFCWSQPPCLRPRCLLLPRKRCRWRSRAMIRSPISPSETPRAGCRRSNTNGTSTATAFRGAEHRELFKADPVRYAPQFGNFCAMALTRGELDEANPENWLISDGKLYIFGKADGTRAVPAGPCWKHRARPTRTAPLVQEALAVALPAAGGRLRRARGRPCGSRRAGVRDRPGSETCFRTSADRRSGRCGESSARHARRPPLGFAAHRRPPARHG